MCLGVFVQVNADSHMAKAKPIGYVVEESGCWTWVGGRNEHGYGIIGKNRGSYLAHKWFYEQARGPVPGGLELDHLCRQRDCVNPDHLEAVSHRVNTLRGDGVASINANKTHCPNGHPYNGANTYYYQQTQRLCRECTKQRNREYMRRRRAINPNYGLPK